MTEKIVSRQGEPTTVRRVMQRRPQRATSFSALQLRRALAQPRAGVAPLQLAQQAYGNRAIQRLIQAKLTVEAANDPYEREADQVADRVMTMRLPEAGAVQRQGEEDELQTQRLQRAPAEDELQTKPLAASITRLQRAPEDEEEVQTQRLQRAAEEDELQTQRLQRAPEDEEEVQTQRLQRAAEEDELQTQRLQRAPEDEEVQTTRAARSESFDPGADFESRLGAQQGGGQPLPSTLRRLMEPRFGTDFSGVRVHTDGAAAQLNREVSAQAFTHGQDIYFGAGHYQPDDESGQRLLAHELTHTIQQTGGQQLHHTAG